MAENTATAPDQNVKIASVGQPKAATFPIAIEQQSDNPEQAQPQNTSPAPDASSQAPTNAAQANAAAAPSNEPQITEDAFRSYLKGQGIEFSGTMDEFKQRFAAPATAPELTDEQKKETAAKAEKILLDRHLAKGGTPEDFVTIKAMANGDPKGLARQSIERQLIDEGFHVERAKKIVEQMHFEVSAEELEAMDEDDRKEIEKKRDFALKQLEKNGSSIIENAKGYLEDLKAEADELDAQKAKTEQYLSTVEDTVKNFVRKQNFELGKHNGQELSPVEFDVTDDVLAEVKELLSPESIKKNFLTPDGQFNTQFFASHFVRSLSASDIAKASYLKGQTNGVKTSLSNFSPTPVGLGNGNNKQGSKNEPVRAGEPVYVQQT